MNTKKQFMFIFAILLCLGSVAASYDTFFHTKYEMADGMLYGFDWMYGEKHGYLCDISERVGDKSQVRPLSKVQGCRIRDIDVFEKSDTLLRKLIVPMGYKYIYRFWNFKNLETVVLPFTMEEIHLNAFMGCENIKEFKIHRMNRHLRFKDGNLLFQNTSALLYSVNGARIPEGTRKICDGAFANRHDTSTVYIPNSVTSIMSYAFGSNSSIKEVVFSAVNERFMFKNGNIMTKNDSALVCLLSGYEICDDVRVLQSYLFYGREDINSIRIPDGVVRIDTSCFERCCSLKHVSLPKTLKVVGYDAFNYSGIESLDIPEGVEIIEGSIGSCNKLQSVSIPKTIKEIPRRAFSYCENLKIIQLYRKNIKIGEEAFHEEKKVVYWNRKDISTDMENNQPEDELWVVYE